MGQTLIQLCETLSNYGFEARAHGMAQAEITGVATLEAAGPHEVSFLSNQKYIKSLSTTEAGAVVTSDDIEAPEDLPRIITSDPYAAITALIVALHGYRKHPQRQPDEPAIHPTAQIGENAQIAPGVSIDHDVMIGDNAVIYSGCTIGPRCRIGSDLILYPNVTVYDDCVLGDRVSVHSGTVIGNDGLGYAPLDGKWVKIPQIGIVRIGDDVEIGSNCSIDRATLGETVIGRGTKMSNLIAVGHGAKIGEDCMIVAQVGLAGSCTVGNHVTLAGQVGVVGHIRIGDNATIGAKAGVVNDVPDGATYLGQPAIPIRDMRRQGGVCASTAGAEQTGQTPHPPT
jgi:UDP-3-O-[3-hydroxymyristoyl] glucosamine N-acyltransferase